MQIRKAAATAREALLDQAASRLGMSRDRLVVQAGTVAPRAGGPGVTYAALLQGRSLLMKVDPAVRTKDPKDYRIVGTPVRRLDIPAKIFGTFDFVHDVRVPDMVHARMVHPAAVGARAISSPWWRVTNGRPFVHRARWGPSGAGEGLPDVRLPVEHPTCLRGAYTYVD
jgi:CO/xanthine dehydrogenase Mo-binding subunit